MNKYLLEINTKKNLTVSISVELTANLRMFEDLRSLIAFLFKGAAFIESYEIFMIELFEGEKVTSCQEDRRDLLLEGEEGKITIE